MLGNPYKQQWDNGLWLLSMKCHSASFAGGGSAAYSMGVNVLEGGEGRGPWPQSHPKLWNL